MLRHVSVFRLSVRRFETLVSTQWLSDHLSQSGGGQNGLRVLHVCSDGGEYYKNCHIPGAYCFDTDYCRDTESQYKNMLPSPEKFANYVSAMGVKNDTHVVVYDHNGKLPSIYVATRLWYMFRVFGHDMVSVLNGGLYRWIIEQRPTATGEHIGKPLNGNFIPDFRPELVANFEQVLDNITNEKFTLIDSRPRAKYEATTSDNPNIAPGHIKSAINMPISNFLDPDTKLIHDSSQLKESFRQAGINLNKPMVSSCRTGVFACATVFAAHRCGIQSPMYDGSWFEFSRRAPKEAIEIGSGRKEN